MQKSTIPRALALAVYKGAAASTTVVITTSYYYLVVMRTHRLCALQNTRTRVHTDKHVVPLSPVAARHVVQTGKETYLQMLLVDNFIHAVRACAHVHAGPFVCVCMFVCVFLRVCACSPEGITLMFVCVLVCVCLCFCRICTLET